MAAAQLQQYLHTQTDLDHHFGLEENLNEPAIGKMFGVLVVQDSAGRLGYLSAFSGKLAGTNDHPEFVPPVFDMLTEDSFFLKEQLIINSVNEQVDAIASDTNYLELKLRLEQLSAEAQKEIAAFKAELKANKADRKSLREKQISQSNEEQATFEALMIRHSLHDKHRLNLLIKKWDELLLDVKLDIARYEGRIEALKTERKERSAALQQQLFEQYVFLNQYGNEKSLQDIFSDTYFGKPPAGAGECAAPKLLQYAFLHGYKPLAMAEFWWGVSPLSEIRKHQQFYPACTGKCKPILEHMLEGIPLDENLLLHNPGAGKKLDIVYEDDNFIVVNKPAELLSVPGIQIQDSVYSRLKASLAGIEPLIIHRLDMATSGLLVVAKTKAAHQHIQRQFLKRTVVKRYTALLSKVIAEEEIEINLPLRGDPDNRPRQLVCFEHGKKATTLCQVVQRNETTTKVHFWPHTGRTHQLRMHAAHEQGLNAPIVGDELYGTPAERLYLHASYLEFEHPVTKEILRFEVAEDF
ncbi:RNA pseudouridine synthase [Mucilaginibacter sp. HMF5004]|nr:RNA pseudouridine synthase [Mucilaginibacter rivuli]